MTRRETIERLIDAALGGLLLLAAACLFAHIAARQYVGPATTQGAKP